MFYAESFAEGGHLCAFEFRAVVGDKGLRQTESGKDVAHDETDEMGDFNLSERFSFGPFGEIF